jgi:DNA replication protein DnaC
VIGYLPIDRQGANLFFQLISRRRYERGPMILTGNQSCVSWGEIFGVPDHRHRDPGPHPPPRHHAQHPGQSYRLKDKLKAGLVRPTEASE